LGSDTYYCLWTNNRTTEQDDFYCTKASGENCTQIAYIPANTLLKPAASGYPEDSFFDNAVNNILIGKSPVPWPPNLLFINKEQTGYFKGDFGGVVTISDIEKYYTRYYLLDWQELDEGKTYLSFDKSGTKCGCSHSSPRGDYDTDSAPEELKEQSKHTDHWLGDDCWVDTDKHCYGTQIVAGAHDCPGNLYQRWCWIDNCDNYNCSDLDCGAPGVSSNGCCVTGSCCADDEWRTKTYCYLPSERQGYYQTDYKQSDYGVYAQYCQQIAKVSGESGILATDKYYQWEKTESPDNALDCFTANGVTKLGEARKCAYNTRYYNNTPDGDISPPFSSIGIGQGDLKKKIPVGPDSIYGKGHFGGTDFYSCGGNCPKGTNERASAGATRLGDIFKEFDVLNWDETSGEYSKTSTENRRNESGAGNHHPEIASVECKQSGECFLKRTNRVTIGNKEKDDTVIIRDQTYPAILKFYAWADKDHMPITEVSVDWSGWGETGMNIIHNKMQAKNHKPYCCDSETSCEIMVCSNGTNRVWRSNEDCIGVGDCVLSSSENLNFGNIPDACQENYFQFTYIYTCEGEGSPGWEEFGCKEACCFKPKVWVKDNWGWCNGGNYKGDANCYGSNAGTSFGGIIKIKP